MGGLVCCGWVGFGNCVLGLVAGGVVVGFWVGEFGEGLIFGWWAIIALLGCLLSGYGAFCLGLIWWVWRVGFCVFPGFGGFLCASVA